MRSKCSRVPILIASVTLVGMLAAGSPAQETANMAQLRRDYAMRNFEPSAHAALIKGVYLQKRYMVAYGLTEHARRRFDQSEFGPAYGKAMVNRVSPSLSPERCAELEKHLDQVPEGDVQLLTDLLWYSYATSRWSHLEKVLKRLLEVDPEHADRHLRTYETFTGSNYLNSLAKVTEEFAEQHPDAAASVVVQARAAAHPTAGKTARNRAKRILARGLRDHPDDPYIHYMVGEVAAASGDLDAAERHYSKAASLHPHSELILRDVGRFFLTKRKDLDRSLQYYVRAYFGNYYGNAIWKVKEIKKRRAKERVNALRAKGVSWTEIVREDDQDVANRALIAMARDWKPEYVAALTELLAHDHPYLSENSARLLAAHVDATFEPKLEELLAHEDLRVRARALYIALALRGEKAHPLLEKALESDCQLIRWESVGALFLGGGEVGKRIVEAHRKRESVAALIKAIDVDLEKWPAESKLRPEPAKPAATGATAAKTTAAYAPLAPPIVKPAPGADDVTRIPEGCVAAGSTSWQQLEVDGKPQLLPGRIRHEATGIELVLIAPGWYYRGAGEAAGWTPPEEKPRHKVTITRPFYLARHETTNKQYRLYMPKHLCFDRRYRVPVNNDPQQPACEVSWDGATGFARKFGFRLPTEAEWEYACRAGTSGPHYGPVREIAWFHDVTTEPKHRYRTHPVGLKTPNAWGLFDMLGNAREWCSDWFDEKAYAGLKDGVCDPKGPATGEWRVMRGGDVTSADLDGSTRTSNRQHMLPTAAMVTYGFRVAMDP